jgi:hypothetical protein
VLPLHHILFVCPTWTVLRTEILSNFCTRDLRILLNDSKGAKVAVKFVIQTEWLIQFKLIARSEQTICQQLLNFELNYSDNERDEVNESESKQDNLYLSSSETGNSQPEYIY